jgi:hypothetical protein
MSIVGTWELQPMVALLKVVSGVPLIKDLQTHGAFLPRPEGVGQAQLPHLLQEKLDRLAEREAEKSLVAVITAGLAVETRAQEMFVKRLIYSTELIVDKLEQRLLNAQLMDVIGAPLKKVHLLHGASA